MEKIKNKLHLGCGSKIIPNFTNIDIRPLEGVDLVDDISKLNTIENNSVELIYACHVLEHFGRHEYIDVLRRWYEVLDNGGKLRISIPDFEKVVDHYNKNKDLKKILGFLYGGQNYEQNYHYCGWDFESIKNDLLSIGFKDVYRYEWTKTEHSNIDDFSQAYLPHMDKKNGTLMSLNIEAIK
jgi:ubiquinone/menaquinone biosynthesis C-methylase UbiE